MKAKWKPAVKAIAWRGGVMDLGLSAGLALMVLPAVSASERGIAVCWPTFKLGTARTNLAVGSKSGLVMLRYRDQKLVSMVSWVRLVRRPVSLAPAALLLGNTRNLSRSTASAPLESKYFSRKDA